MTKAMGFNNIAIVYIILLLYILRKMLTEFNFAI